MKIKKFTEQYSDNESIDDYLINKIYSVLDSELYMEYAPYTDDYIISNESKKKSAQEIFNILVEIGINFELLKNTGKYNL